MFDNPIAAGAAVGLAEKRGDELGVANSEIDYANRVIAAKNKEIANLQDDVIRVSAAAAGLDAQVDALWNRLKEVAPNDPLFEKIGPAFVSGELKGQRKSKLRLTFEAASDVVLKKAGVENPLAYRDG